MRVLLINPNTFHFPPVPPIGLEYIAGALERAGHETAMADLCFSRPEYRELDDAISGFSPEIIGITVRNVDTVLYQTNEFFLDGIRLIVDHIKSNSGLKVIVGGTGVSTNPEGVREYLGADYAVAGPGEDAIINLLEAIRQSREIQRVISGRYAFEISCPRKKGGINYKKYIDQGGIAGFETHKGCGSSCVYCTEANSRVSFRRIGDIMAELKDFADAGIKRFHLCDSEFNEDLDHAVDFCTALKNSGINIDWAIYMKPANYNKKLFRLMKETGVSLITLTVDTWKKCSLYWSDIEKIIFHARSIGIKIAVDLLAGFPYEAEETFLSCLDLLRRTAPDTVGINTYIRLYESLPITTMIRADQHLRGGLLGDKEDSTFVQPVFYNSISAERVREIINGESLFRIEGLERGVNYGRVYPPTK